ncbi:MAG: APC family permease [Kiritimatiellae bacterium]|nr:APC family permease [Kiritimatiellia bacterium]
MATFVALVADINGVLSGAVLTVGFVALNILGVREAARAQAAIVFSLLALLVLYVLAGIPQIRSELLIPSAPHGVGAIFSTAGFVFVSYGGLLKVASVAEEVRNPGRVMPLGLALALVIVTLLYTLVVAVTSGVLEEETLNGSLTPISDGGRVIMGDFGFVAMSIAAILAFVSTANAGIMAASRYLLALSRDSMLPAGLSRVNARFRTPHIAVIVTGSAILLSLLLPLEILVEAASCVLILTYMLSCLAVIVLRESGLGNYRPLFRSPLYPWLQIGGLIGLGFVLFELGVEAYAIIAVLILAAFGVFWFYGRRDARQKSALLHLIARLTDRRLVSGSLEAELKQIIKERDEIVWDRFDRLVQEVVVVSPPGPKKDVQMDLGSILRGAQIAEHLEQLIEFYGAPLIPKHESVDAVIAKHLIVPLDSPPRYPPYNGAIEYGQREFKELLEKRYPDAQQVLAAQSSAVQELNHHPKPCLDGRVPCAVLQESREVMKSYTRPKRKEVIGWIRREVLVILQSMGERASVRACDAAWRRAVETWLHRNGAITVSVNGDVLPCYPKKRSH